MKKLGLTVVGSTRSWVAAGVCAVLFLGLAVPAAALAGDRCQTHLNLCQRVNKRVAELIDAGELFEAQEYSRCCKEVYRDVIKFCTDGSAEVLSGKQECYQGIFENSQRLRKAMRDKGMR